MKINQITFSRFLAAISIVIYHYGLQIAPFNNKTINYLFSQANIGVSFFFILSGFVMVVAYSNKLKIEVINYFKNRIARIYPVYILAIILLIVYVIISSKHLNINDITINLLFIQTWIPGKALTFNYPAWSLSVEIFFYVIFPFLFNYFYSKYTFKQLLIPFIFIWLMSQLLLHMGIHSGFYKGFPSKSHDLIYYFPLMHFNQFLMGNLAGIYYVTYLKNKQSKNTLPLLLLSIILIIFLKFNYWFILHNGFLIIFFIPLILLISINNGIISNVLKNRFFVFLGEISYGIYILQVPVFLSIEYYYKKFQLGNNFSRFYFSLVVLLFLATISYYLIENPLRKKIINWSFS